MAALIPAGLPIVLGLALTAGGEGAPRLTPPTGQGADLANPSPETLGFSLDPRFTWLCQGSAAGSFIEADDGALLNLASDGGGTVRVSRDGGRSWSVLSHMYEGPGPGKPTKDLECAIALKTRSGALLWIYRDMENFHWQWDDARGEAVNPTLDVWSIRSLDGGKTWVDRQRVFQGYCGSLNDIVQTRDGNVVVPVQRYLPDPGRHAQAVYVSQDDGKSWRRSNVLDFGGHGHHDGAMEGTLAELDDGRLLMLLRTGLDRFWEATSWDGGLTWRGLQPSAIPASSAPGYVIRLASGRLALVWNGLTPGKQVRALSELKPGPKPAAAGFEIPADWYRDGLSIALSEDDGKTWGAPVVFAKGKRLCYPQIREHRPGELWISFVAGPKWVRNLVHLRETDLPKR